MDNATKVPGSRTKHAVCTVEWHSMNDVMTRIAQLNSKWKKWSPVLVLISLIFPIGVCLNLSLQFINFHGDTSFPESAVVYNALLASKDGHLYRSWQDAPFTTSPYGPLYYGVLALMAKIGSLGQQSLLVAGRIWSFASSLGATFLVYLWARRLGVSKLLAVIGAAFFAALHDLVPWNVTTRPDLPALFLMAYGLFLFSSEQAKKRDMIISSVCFAAGLLIKHSFIAAPAALFLWLMWKKRFGHALLLVVITSSLVSGTFLALVLAGEPVFSNILSMKFVTSDLAGFWKILFEDTFSLGLHFPLLVCMVVALVWRRNSPGTRVLQFYLLFSWMIGVMTLVHSGSNTNVLIEAWFVSSVFVALGLQFLFEKAGGTAMVALAVFIVLCSTPTYRMLGPYHMRPMQPMPHINRMVDLVSTRKVLSDDSYLESQSAFPIMLCSNCNVLFEQQKAWDPKPVIEMVQGQGFDLVMLTTKDGQIREYRGVPFLSRTVLGAVGANYTYRCQLPKSPGFSDLGIWTPNDKLVPPETMSTLQSMGCR